MNEAASDGYYSYGKAFAPSPHIHHNNLLIRYLKNTQSTLNRSLVRPTASLIKNLPKPAHSPKHRNSHTPVSNPLRLVRIGIQAVFPKHFPPQVNPMKRANRERMQTPE